MKPESEPPGTTPAHIRELARACEEHVQRTVGTALDGTPETLPLLDHYLRGLDPRAAAPVHELVMSTAGAYFGEVVRRRFGCRWHAPEGKPFAWRIEFEEIFLHFNPAAVAYEAIVRHESGFGASFETFEPDQQMLREVFGRIPPVREEDYYTLAMRLEVLERVVAEITVMARSRGDREGYSAADYRAELDEEN